MQKLLLALLFLLSFSICYCSALCFTISDDSLKGNVKQMKVYLLTENKGGERASIDSLLITSRSFDRNKNTLEEILFADDGGMMTKVKCKYNSNGDKIEIAVYDGTNKLHNKTTFQYNENRKLTEEVSYEKENEVESKITYAYDKAENIISETKTREGGELLKKKLFSYDENGNMIEEKQINNSGILEIRLSYKYDERHNKTEEIRYDGDREECKTIYTYTIDNRKKSEAHQYNFEKSNSHIEWKYDSENHLISEITSDYQNEAIQKNSFIYLNGKLIREEKNNSINEYEYEYDSLGHLTKEKKIAGTTLMSEKEFDVKGNVLSWLHFSRGVFSYSESNLFDSTHTVLLQMTKRDKQNTILEDIYYLYDAKGNISEEQNKDGDSKILSRKIFAYIYY